MHDEVIKVFNDMKVRKYSSPEEVKKRKKAVLFCLSDDKKQIIVEDAREILVGEIGESVQDPYASFVKLLPLADCRYALYDATYETKESKKEDLVFIFWYVLKMRSVDVAKHEYQNDLFSVTETILVHWALTFSLYLFRAPELASLKSKMIYASSKDAIKKKFTGL